VEGWRSLLALFFLRLACSTSFAGALMAGRGTERCLTPSGRSGYRFLSAQFVRPTYICIYIRDPPPLFCKCSFQRVYGRVSRSADSKGVREVRQNRTNKSKSKSPHAKPSSGAPQIQKQDSKREVKDAARPPRHPPATGEREGTQGRAVLLRRDRTAVKRRDWWTWKSPEREILDFEGVSWKRGALLNKNSIPEW